MPSSPTSNFTVSLAFQVLLYFDYYFCWLYFILGILTFIYKPLALPYPSPILGAETASFTFLAILQSVRLYMGYRGNLTQQRLPIIAFICLSLGSILGHVFFYGYQTYVLRIDQVVNVICLIFVCCEELFAFITLIQLAQKPIV